MTAVNGYKLKQKPEDFVVKEVPGFQLSESGDYMIFRLWKKNYTSEKAVQQLAACLKIDRKRIGYAGNKDRHAVTEQFISIRNADRNKAESLSLKDLALKFVGYSSEPISLGDLKGNNFEIIVRNISDKPAPVKRFVNYFGEQRFSTNNAEIGKAIIKKEFEKACSLVLENNGYYEEKVEAHLESQENDFVGALKRAPWKILNLFVHAYQSRLWNEIAREYIKNCSEPDNIRLPLIGFATEIKNNQLKSIVDAVMRREGISFNDFIIRQIPELSSEGDERTLFADVKELHIGELEDDELNQGMKKVKLGFFLSKGCYATELVKQMLDRSLENNL